MIAILTPWPPSVATGSGTTVSQNRLLEALHLAGAEAELVYTSRFASSPDELADRERRNRELGSRLQGYEAVIGIDGEGWLWAPQRRVPYVACCEAVLVEVLPFEHGAAAEVLRAQAGWEGAAARAADAVVARSEFAAKRIAEAYGVERARITVLPIPFDVDAWQAALPPLPKEPLVLSAGHAYARKNYRALLDGWPSVVRAHPQARLVIAGDGPELPALQRQANELPSVSLPGHIPYSELLALYARASVFCHPSLQENFGIAIVEALASGASVVAHQQPAVLENLSDLPGVLVIDASKPAALADALVQALGATPNWPARRLDGLRAKLDPLRIGRQLLTLVGGT